MVQQQSVLAFSLFFRYNGDPENISVTPVISLLGHDDLMRTQILGHALRLAYTLIGAAPSLLPMTNLEVTKDELVLNLIGKGPNEREIFTNEAVERRLTTLARGLERMARVV